MVSVVVFVMSFSILFLLALFGLYVSKLAERKKLEEKVSLNRHGSA